MNKARRRDIARIAARLSDLGNELFELKTDLESIRDEEQESFDNLPEGLQASEQGQNSEAAVSALETAIGSLEDIDFEEVDSQLDEAQN